MTKYSVILITLIGFALLNTALVGTSYLAPAATASIRNAASEASVVVGLSGVPGSFVVSDVMGVSVGTLQVLDEHSLALAPTSWLIAGLVVWRGRVRANWMALGFDSDVFELFVTSKGAGTRVKILNALSAPKVRLQIARELSLSWRAVDRHMNILRNHELVNVQIAYCRVKVYSVSVTGEKLLNLIQRTEAQQIFSTSVITQSTRITPGT